MFKNRIPLKYPEETTILEKIIKSGLEFLKGKLSYIFGKTKQTNIDNCEINDLSEINRIFNEFIKSIEPKINDIEKSIKDEMYYYLDELVIFIEDNEKLIEHGIKMNRFKRDIEKLKYSIDGSMKKEISKKISLDNNECIQIMKMIPGEKKTKKMDELFEKCLTQSIENTIEKIKSSIEDIVEDIEIFIEDKLDSSDEYIKNQMNLLDKLNNDTDKDVYEKEAIICDAIEKIQVSDCVLKILLK